ncbi:MAG: hypothetical protein CMJ95_04260 [Planctomycetes bacterium]|nr:hypothetical protein [Planctomycetota bacterium]
MAREKGGKSHAWVNCDAGELPGGVSARSGTNPGIIVTKLDDPGRTGNCSVLGAPRNRLWCYNRSI